MEIKSNNNLLLVILLSLIFGIGGGVCGEIIARVYLLQDAYNIPFFGNVNVPNNVYGGSSLIIDSPKKVIVEQNTKALETINSAGRNIVGIFKKIEEEKATGTSATSSPLNLKRLYRLDKPLSQGSVVTSDGWIMSSFIPQEFKDQETEEKNSSSTIIKKIIESYVVISSDGKLYNVVDVNIDKNSNASFWRIDAKDLGVKQFKKINEINKGQIVVAVNFQGRSWLTTISEKYPNNLPDVLSSDVSYSELIFVNNLNKEFGEAFIYSLEGDLIALSNSEGKVKPVSSYFTCLTCLLEKKDLAHPYLGLKYIDISKYSDNNSKAVLGEGALIYPDENGVAVIKGSPAEKAGLQSGDIIVAVNAIKINGSNKLSDIISELKPGETINLTIKRAKEDKQISVVLGGKK